MPTLPLLALLSPAPNSVRRNPPPVPNIPGFQTLKCDFQMHTVFSDGEVWPETRVREAFRDGLDAIALTDHDDSHPHRETVSAGLMQPHKLAAGPAALRNASAIPFIAQAPGGEPFTIAALASTAVSMKDKEQTDLELRNLHATDSAAPVKATVRIR